jgi:hypothetical protein
VAAPIVGATAACAFLIGSTGLGWFLASYLIAPLITGGSHDSPVE